MQTQEEVLEQLMREIAKLNEKVESLRESRPPVMLTYEEAARELRVGLTVLKRMVKDGALLVVEGIGGRKRIPYEEIQRLARTARRMKEPVRAGGRKPQQQYDAKAEAAKLNAALKAERRKR